MMAPLALGARRHDDTTSCGIYTKTIVRSPVIRWILHAQIRHSSFNDAVFVGEDYVEVKEVGRNGHLQYIATKSDFDAHITAAAVFNTNDDDTEVDFLAQIKQEASQDGTSAGYCPPQLVALTLDSNNLVFLALKPDHDGAPRFIQCIVPLPCFDRTLFQPGQHLAVDPYSRAIAVAARQDQVILYGAKSKEQLKYELKNKPSEFCPISATRPFKIDGAIQHMDFLTPPSTSSDHVILLLIIICDGRTKAARIEWPYTLGPRKAQLHPAQVLGESTTVPSLLIPLREAAFFLISENDITLWKDILSGSASDSTWSLPDDEVPHPGISPRSPIWASWAKPRRSKAAIRDKDALYLVREDGKVMWITIKVGAKSTLNMSCAGDLECHVGTAFASLGDEGGPDILAIAGETSSGRTVSIGPFFTPRRIEEMSREEAMKFDTIETIHNWASATDMISAKQLHANRHQSAHTDNVLVTSGRQPYGSVTEIRRGLEGRLATNVPLEGLKDVIDLWAIPDRSMGSVVIVLSYPWGIRLLRVDGEFEDMFEIDDLTAFDLAECTLTAGITAGGQLVQVTSHGFCVTGSIQGNFEDTVRKKCEGNTNVVAAKMLEQDNFLITAEVDGSNCNICCYSVTSPDNEPEIQLRGSVGLQSQALCIAAARIGEDILVTAAKVDGTIDTILFTSSGSSSLAFTSNLPEPSANTGSPSICDHMVILQADSQDDQSGALSLVCGLRDGRIVTFTIMPQTNQGLVQTDVITFRDSTVRLVPLNNDRSAAYALSGGSICLLSWDGSTSFLENIWLADKAEPEMAQPAVIGCAQTPQAMWLSSSTMAELLVVASEDGLFFATLQQVPTTVPRQIPVDGTPNRLIHAESLRSIVCSTLFAGVRTFPSSRPHTAPEERRQTWPIIHFIPSGKNSETSYQYPMQPGDRVHALLEWSYKARQRDKTYSFVLVGGRHMRRNGQLQGRVWFLQPRFSRNRSWEVESVTERHTLDFPDEVYALSQLDDHTIVICTGELVYYYAYREESNDWQRVQVTGTKEVLRLASPGIYATVDKNAGDSDPSIAVSTAQDSLVVMDGQSGEITTMGPHAQNLLCHHVVLETFEQNGNMRRLALVSTKQAEVTGLSWASNGKPNQPAQIEFAANLPRSLTRMVASGPPARKGSPPEGILNDRIVGCATGGALVGMVLIDPSLWRRLSWLQRLIEWSPVLSPHAQESPTYDFRDNEDGGVERGMPIGLGKKSNNDLVPLQTSNHREHDLHIDGDVLSRVLETKGGVEEVKNVMKQMASEPEHAAGRWLLEHLDEELVALEEVVGLVRDLERWM